MGNEGLILNVLLIFSFVLQNVVPAEVSLVCVVKPDEFWDKKVTHFCFWKEKDRLGFEVCRTLYFSQKYHFWNTRIIG